MGKARIGLADQLGPGLRRNILLQHPSDIGLGQGFREIMALRLLAARRDQQRRLALGLDPFSEDRKVEIAGEPDHAPDDLHAVLIMRHIRDEGLVDLDA